MAVTAGSGYLDKEVLRVAQTNVLKQFSFRLPEALVEQVEDCADHIRAQGLEVTRADVVRLLLKHALDATRCRLDLLLRPAADEKPRHKK
jgi:hypothetical protein